MKRLLFALALTGLFLPAAPKANAQVDVSVDFFYDNLASDGSWVEVGDYGYCWQPQVAVTDTSWRPYADGSWAYTDVGWTWVSNERFGWATYHYGRWVRLSGRGWVWVPGYEWAPAWVSWRTGGDYVGWAPLPPRLGAGGELVYAGRPIGGAVDVEFDIGPAYYNFVNIRYIGEPSLRSRIYAPTQNIAYITKTVNVTNITYNNTVINNYGPDYNRLSAYADRPIRRLKLQREANADYRAAAQSGALTTVQGDNLIVAAPMKLQKPAQPVAPKVVKERIAQPKPETGWSGVADPKAKTALQEKMKKEDPKTVPPPTVKPKHPAALNAGNGGDATAAPAAAADATAPANAAGAGKGKNKRGPASQPVPDGAAPAAADASANDASNAASANPPGGKAKNKKGNEAKHADAPAMPPDAAAASAPDASAAPAANQPRGKGKNNKHNGSNAPGAATPDSNAAAAAAEPQGPAANAHTNGDQPRGKGKNKGGNKAPGAQSAPSVAPAPQANRPSGPAPAPSNANHGNGKGNAKHNARPQAPAADMNNGAGGPAANAPRTHAAPPPAPQANGRKANNARPQAAPPPAQPGPAAPQAGAPHGGKPPTAAPGQPAGKPGKGDDKKKKKNGEVPPQ